MEDTRVNVRVQTYETGLSGRLSPEKARVDDSKETEWRAVPGQRLSYRNETNKGGTLISVRRRLKRGSVRILIRIDS